MSSLVLNLVRPVRIGWLFGSSFGCQTRQIATTAALFAEPPRKKRRIDPAVFRVRVERKIKKLEREVARLENEPRQIIPILEYEYTSSELRTLNSRPKHNMEDFGLTEGTLRAAQRLWNFYCSEQTLMESKSLRSVVAAQAKALDQLKELDEELYNNTVTIDEDADPLIPYRSSHMRRETDPNPQYTPPDGSIKDITKEWIM